MEYTLLKFDDGMFEIIIQTNDLKHLIEEDKRTASEILIDGILGEEKRMSLICDIEIVDQFEDRYINSQTDIKDLYIHFKNLV